MTKLLEKAFRKASALPAREQDSLASLLLEEIESERRWDELFAKSAPQLEQLANEALAEHRAGKTRPLAVKRKRR